MKLNTRRSGLVATLLALLVTSIGCVKEPLPVPAKLLGTWLTNAPSHANRYLQISYDQLTFGTVDPKASELHALIAIAQSPSDRQYLLTYLDSGGSEHQLKLKYDDANGGTLTFANQPQLVWFKQRG